MCPICITTAALIAGSATSTGGLAAIAIRKFGVKNALDKNPAERRNQDVNEHDRETQNSIEG
jgi:hypothetical protein